MRIIFSRKGFDSQFGGTPSPIVGQKPISLPIPHQSGNVTYRDINLDHFIFDLTKGRINSFQHCHKDPDLDVGAFGQAGAAQGHLNNQGVGNGDLFLFFGTFRNAILHKNRYCWEKDSKPHHRLFGWLFVKEKITNIESALLAGEIPKRYRSHPHFYGKWPPNNTLFIAPKMTELFGEHQIAGFGKFTMTPETLLTHPCFSKKKSFWLAPRWLNPIHGGCGLTYHSINRFSKTGLQTAAKGQEFVAKPEFNDKFKEWLYKLFQTSSERYLNL